MRKTRKKLFVVLLILGSIFFITYYNDNTNKIKKINIEINTNNKTKWIVITSINEPSEQIKQLAKKKNFNLLVIADLKTNSKLVS